jgi:hypothetical protein
VTT